MITSTTSSARAVSTVERVVRAALAVAMLCTSLLLGAGQAAAQDQLDCDEPVVDSSGLVDVVAVQDAIAAVSAEVTIVVRSFDRVPDADLVAAVDDVVVSCFGDEQDGVAEDVIVLGLSVGDRLSDVLIGARWGAAVSDPDRLRNEVMGIRFAEGDYTGGLVDAVNEIGERVEIQLSDAAVAAEAAADPLDDPAGEGDEEAIEPVGGGQSPWAIAGGLVGIGACGGVIYLVNRHRKLASAREELQAASAGPIARLGVVRERDGRLAAQTDVWSMTTAGRTLVALRGLQRETESGRAATDRASGLLTTALPDGVEKADRAEVERARKRVMELSRALDLQDESLDRLAAFGAHIDHLRVALPAKVELLDEEIDEALELAGQRESEGWAVDGHRGELKQVGEVIDSVDFGPLELDLLAMSEQVEGAEARLFAADHYLQSLPSRVNSLKEWNAGLEAAADLELQRIEELRRQFAVLAATHASDSWQWAADFPEQALEELERADELQDVAITEMISHQRFDDAGRQLDVAGMRLIAADHLLDQVDDLIVDLERARQEAPGIVAESRAVLHDVAAYVSQHRSDLDDAVVARPAQLALAVDGLEQELRQVKPNYLRVAETGDRVNRQVDELLAAAKDQHTRADALRRELAREVSRAGRALARARRSLGWELFKSSDGHALDQLEQRLRHLPEAVEQAIGGAADVADDALRIQERIIARRRRRGVWVSTGGGGWTSGGGGWSSGGRSSGSGGRSFGGGTRSSGGRSFGGGGRSSGGRSFGGGRSSGSF